MDILHKVNVSVTIISKLKQSKFRKAANTSFMGKMKVYTTSYMIAES